MDTSIQGKTAIVTGAANGIGLAIARRFCELGANVVMADPDEAQLDIEVEAMQDYQGEVVGFHGNLSEKLDIKNLLATTLDKFDDVDILVNAARLFQIDPDDDFDLLPTLLNRNVVSNFRLSRAVARKMIAHSDPGDGSRTIGTIINLSSITPERTAPGLLAYSVSMAAVDQLTRSLALTFARDGIRVNGIAIGSVMTNSLRLAMREDDTLHDIIASQTPLGVVGESSDVAEAAVFLATEKSNFMTGQILRIDGGRSLVDAVPAPQH